MRNRASSAFKRTAAIARYICPNAWWAIPFSVLVVGLVARVVSSTLDTFNWDNYWLMVGVEKPFFEYVTTFGWGYAFIVHYWVSYRVFGDSLSGYLVLPLLSSLAALLVAYWGLRHYWRANLAICIVTMAILAFNGKLRDEFLNREIFTTLTEAKVLIAEWKEEYNQVRPHSAKGYKPPAPEAKMLVTLTLQVVQLLGAGH